MRTYLVNGILLLAFILVQGSLISVRAGVSSEHTILFERNDIRTDKRGEYDVIYLGNCDISRDEGKPQLPVYYFSIEIPLNQIIEGVEVVLTTSENLPNNFYVFPAQPSSILMKEGEQITFTPPDEVVYNSSDLFPPRIIEAGKPGFKRGTKLASLKIYPLQYRPADGTMIFHSEIKFRIHYSLLEVSEQGIRSLMDTEDAPQKQYVIITDESLVNAFQPLGDWKRKKGVPDTIVTTLWIYSQYPGTDDQERIRNFIVDAYQNWGTVWVLLGGDTDVIPARVAFAMDCEAGFHDDENELQADLYYAALDGNWDENQNQIYGEVADSVDLYPEVFVGRAPVSTQAQAQVFVDKILTYEKNPDLSYLDQALFFAEILWFDPYTNEGIAKDMIDEQFLLPQFDPVTKLYEANGNESPALVIAAIESGQNIINHAGHGGTAAMGAGAGTLRNADIDSLNHPDKYGVLFSIGCWTTAFDYDCIAEHWVQNPAGGGVAFIGNSRYGWGSPGNPGYGISDLFDRRFYQSIFEDEIYNIGAALAGAKAHFIPVSQGENVYRWHQYQLTLLGDPQMPLWTDVPHNLTVSFPHQIPVGQNNFTVTVTDSSDRSIEGARVCLFKENGVYKFGFTDISGQITFDIAPISPGDMDVTVTAHNFLTFEEAASVFAEGPYVGVSDVQFEDANSDGTLNPGERIEMSLTLKNFGNQTAQEVAVDFSTSCPFITILNWNGDFDDIVPGDSVTVDSAVVFDLSGDCMNGKVGYLDLLVSDAENHNWPHTIGITVATPILGFGNYTIDDGDSLPEPGEEVAMIVILENKGLAYAANTSAILTTLDEYLTVTVDSAGYGNIIPDSSGTSSTAYQLSIAENCPDTHFAFLNLNLFTGNYTFSDTFIFAVGEAGFFDDMESGEGGWTHSGDDDLWGISSNRSHSGSYSWYCGEEADSQYHNDMEASLVSQEIILPPASYLSFWHWYEVTIYGVDGFYVEITDDGGENWTTYDFIGSGGALVNPLL
ncbi:hypothetical protein ISS37_10590, partial [candidate division KSB1 bacterium]|nr:hypothetical protein [candidate division KSB1 bacterium]